MKKLFSLVLSIALLGSIVLFAIPSSAANVIFSAEVRATTSSGPRNKAKSDGTIWATQRDSSNVDIQGITYVYLYYTKDGSESYYADYDEADNVNTSLYANMSVSVAKWSTDGSSGFHSTHKTQGIENNRITATDTKNVSKANFGK